MAPKYKPRYKRNESKEDTDLMMRVFNSTNHQTGTSVSLYSKFSIRWFFHKILSLRHWITRTTITNVIAIALFYVVLNQFFSKSTSRLRTSESRAEIQSHGLFQDLSELQWLKMQVETRQSRIDHGHETRWVTGKERSWSKDFTCPHEQTLGKSFFFRRGGHTLCNPSGIKNSSNARLGRGQNGCLVYSTYSKPADLKFEKDFLNVVGACEFHIFSRNGLVPGTKLPADDFYLHRWDLERSAEKDLRKKSSDSKSLQDTIQSLGHVGKTVDLFLLDCAGCELNTVSDWFVSDGVVGVEFLQIIAKVHSGRHAVMQHFFSTILRQNYVTYYMGKKEHLAMRWYGFLKLAPDYFIS